MNKPAENGEQQGILGRAMGWLKSNVNQATSLVPKDIAFSHDVFGETGGVATEKMGQPLELLRSNHAWWIGKIPKKSGERVDSIYSPEFINASLELLFKNLGQGEVAQIVMAPCFSRYFNGVKDREMGLPNDEAVAFITGVVKKKFPLKSASIDIHDVEKMPLHVDLFARLNKSFDKKEGVIDPEKAFCVTDEDVQKDGFNLLENPTSLNIARFLYFVSKENQALFQFFRHAAPGRLRVDFDEEPSSKDYYALAEISVRLAEILDGRYVHGGADRQGKYDDFIADMFTAANPKGGKQVKKKAVFAGLEPLIGLFKGKKFETVHLDTLRNPYKVNVDKKRAQTRLAMAGVLSALAIVVPKFGIDFVSEYQRKSNVKSNISANFQLLEDAVDGKCLDYDQCKWGTKGGSVLQGIINEGLYQISLRYGLDEAQIFEIQSAFLAFMLVHQNELSSIGDDNSKLIVLVDKFMHDPMARAKFGDMGLNIFDAYANLKPYEDRFIEMAKGGKSKRKLEGTVNQLSRCAEVDPRMRTSHCPCESSTDLGVFSASSLTQKRYRLVLCEHKDKGDVLVAKPEYLFGDFLEENVGLVERLDRLYNGLRYRYYIAGAENDVKFSSDLVERDVSNAYIDTKRKAVFALIPERFNEYLYKACNPDNYSDLDFSNTKMSAADMSNGVYVHSVKDPFGDFEYEIFVGGDCSKDGGKFLCGQTLLARLPGEENFTAKRAAEFAQVYMKIMHSHWRTDNECKGYGNVKK